MQNYADNIKDLINSYKIHNDYSQKELTRYSLRFNTVKDSNGNWVTSGGAYDDRWLNYNCYAYSIKRNELLPYYVSYPYIQYQPGNMANDESGSNAINEFSDCSNITDLANLVSRDLLAMGYNNITISDSILTTNSSQELICVRMSETDYHFMHYDQETNAWYHKPGNTAVLKYNITPNNSQYWNVEYSFYGQEGSSDDYYDSDIKFIRYNKNKTTLSNVITNVQTSIYVQPGKDTILEINNLVAANYEFDLESNESMVLEIYDNEMIKIETYTGTNISICRDLSVGTFYLKFNFSSTSSYGFITIDIERHNHLYSYSWQNYTQHRATCSCGNTQLQPHIVAEGSFSNMQQYATCLLCGGLATMGFVEMDGLSRNGLTTITANGSYILPNGVIVLVEDDVSLFMNGMLSFNDSYINDIYPYINDSIVMYNPQDEEE